MRILVTGAGGMLGQDVCSELAGEHDVLPTGRGKSANSLDITDLDAIEKLFREFQPEGVIHCAAMTNVDGCERNPTEAYRVNAHGSSLIASATARYNAFLVYISTDYVFDGRAGRPYHEYDLPAPLNVYGYSKWMGERSVQALCAKHYIVRTAWLYGTGGRCFPKIILEAAREDRPLRVVRDQIGSPTFTQDLAGAIARLIQVPAYGIYHLVNSGAVSWYTFAAKILELAGLDNALESIETTEWSSPAQRPAYSPLLSLRMEWLGLPPLRPWHLALKEYLASG